MPKIDFSAISDVSDFAPLPEGPYQVRLIDIEIDRTRNGDDLWILRWQVQGGEHDGRLIFDNMAFTPKAMPKVKLICLCCGIDVSGEISLEPEMLLDKQVIVQTFQDEYEDKGQQKVRTCIPFNGYEPIPDDEASAPF